MRLRFGLARFGLARVILVALLFTLAVSLGVWSAGLLVTLTFIAKVFGFGLVVGVIYAIVYQLGERGGRR